MGSAFLSNLSSPPLLFFFLGVAAVAARSDLDIPNQIAKFLSIYLLFAIGFKGGVALAESSLSADVLVTLCAAMGLSAAIPLYTFFVLRRFLSTADAAAIAATYGSVSAVTFITATGYLTIQEVEWSGHMVAALALMESPAIIVGILLYRKYADGDNYGATDFSWRKLLHEACLNGSVFLITGSMLIGWLAGAEGMSQVVTFTQDIFLGVLCLFLLDMGIVAARRIGDLQESGRGISPTILRTMVIAAVTMPLINAGIGMLIAMILGLNEGDTVLFVVLCASASYIAVPAALRLALPQANPGTYLPMSLAVTFPINILIGIPLYHGLARSLT